MDLAVEPKNFCVRETIRCREQRGPVSNVRLEHIAPSGGGIKGFRSTPAIPTSPILRKQGLLAIRDCGIEEFCSASSARLLYGSAGSGDTSRKFFRFQVCILENFLMNSLARTQHGRYTVSQAASICDRRYTVSQQW